MPRPKIRMESEGSARGLRRTYQPAPAPKLRFVLKVILLMTVLIVLSGLSITTATAYRFRREMYKQEFSSAFTVYSAVANYLSGHYKANRHRFVTKSIDFVLERRFLRVEGMRHDLITHRPSHLVLYDAHGRVLYEFPTHGSAQNLPPSLLPLCYGPTYDSTRNLITIGGPVSPEGDVPGFVEIAFPTEIHQKIREIYLQSFGIMLAIILIAIGFSWIFARHVLAPIEALTEAASRVHRGDLNQHVPISTDDEIGVLAATFNNMVSSLAKQIALLHRIQKWTVKIGKELETQRLYGTLAAMFVRMAGARSCRLYVSDPDSGELEDRFGHGGKRLPRPENDTLAHAAFDERWTQYHDEKGQTTTDAQAAYAVAIPLLSGEHRIGVIRLGRKRDGSAYDEETLTILQTLAQHASVAIENASLYSQLAEKERIEQEMRWAREIQTSLLPHERPVIEGYTVCGDSQPAFEVGGDYFDYVEADGKWYFIIGDVSGKGVPAALIMSIIRSLIRTYIEFEASPRDVLVRVNRKLCDDLEPEMFVTMAVLCLDPTENRLCIARAGHEPVLRVRAAGEVEELLPQGVALGIVDIPTFEEHLETMDCQLDDNDTIVLYTDGITEAQNSSGDEFGYERLKNLLLAEAGRPAQELFDLVMGEVDAFATNTAQHDDITLVMIRRNAR